MHDPSKITTGRPITLPKPTAATVSPSPSPSVSGLSLHPHRYMRLSNRITRPPLQPPHPPELCTLVPFCHDFPFCHSIGHHSIAFPSHHSVVSQCRRVTVTALALANASARINIVIPTRCVFTCRISV